MIGPHGVLKTQCPQIWQVLHLEIYLSYFDVFPFQANFWEVCLHVPTLWWALGICKFVANFEDPWYWCGSNLEQPKFAAVWRSSTDDRDTTHGHLKLSRVAQAREEVQILCLPCDNGSKPAKSRIHMIWGLVLFFGNCREGTSFGSGGDGWRWMITEWAIVCRIVQRWNQKVTLVYHFLGVLGIHFRKQRIIGCVLYIMFCHTFKSLSYVKAINTVLVGDFKHLFFFSSK